MYKIITRGAEYEEETFQIDEGRLPFNKQWTTGWAAEVWISIKI